MKKAITNKDIERSIQFMIGKKLTIEQRKKLKYFWKHGNLLKT
jgi:hypothetical protein